MKELKNMKGILYLDNTEIIATPIGAPILVDGDDGSLLLPRAVVAKKLGVKQKGFPKSVNAFVIGDAIVGPSDISKVAVQLYRI